VGTWLSPPGLVSPAGKEGLKLALGGLKARRLGPGEPEGLLEKALAAKLELTLIKGSLFRIPL
jgi:hypothetical protein